MFQKEFTISNFSCDVSPISFVSVCYYLANVSPVSVCLFHSQQCNDKEKLLPINAMQNTVRAISGGYIEYSPGGGVGQQSCLQWSVGVDLLCLHRSHDIVTILPPTDMDLVMVQHNIIIILQVADIIIILIIIILFQILSVLCLFLSSNLQLSFSKVVHRKHSNNRISKR